MLTTCHKDDTIVKIQIYEGIAELKNGEMSINDKSRSVNSSTTQTNTLIKLQNLCSQVDEKPLIQHYKCIYVSYCIVQKL